MGGLDCRYLVSQLSPCTFKVLSVTTISSPHRGSTFANHFIDTIGRESITMKSSDGLILTMIGERMPTLVSLLDMLPNGGGDGKAFEYLTPEHMREFNELVLDDPVVAYFSWGATYEPSLLDPFRWPHGVILTKEGQNDGLVSIESAKWVWWTSVSLNTKAEARPG